MDFQLHQLIIVQDGDLLEGSPPSWVSWDSNNNYLSEGFYNLSSTLSYSAFTQWIKNDPITADGNNLASYKQVELVILGFRLAFRAIWIVQFPDQYQDVPAYIINSCYPFTEYDQLSHCIDDLLSGCGEMYVQTSDCLALLISIFLQPSRNTNGLSTQDATTVRINLKAYISGHRK